MDKVVIHLNDLHYYVELQEMTFSSRFRTQALLDEIIRDIKAGCKTSIDGIVLSTGSQLVQQHLYVLPLYIYKRHSRLWSTDFVSKVRSKLDIIYLAYYNNYLRDEIFQLLFYLENYDMFEIGEDDHVWDHTLDMLEDLEEYLDLILEDAGCAILRNVELKEVIDYIITIDRGRHFVDVVDSIRKFLVHMDRLYLDISNDGS